MMRRGGSPSQGTIGCRWSRAEGWSASSRESTAWRRSPGRCDMAGGPSASPPTVEPRRAAAVVDLGAVTRNCALLKQTLGSSELCAVVKADGYGHGAVECARAAMAGGAERLAVAAAAEAVQLREQGITASILVMGALTTAELELAVSAGADVVCWHTAFVTAVSEAAERARAVIGVHAKVDSGM